MLCDSILKPDENDNPTIEREISNKLFNNYYLFNSVNM